MAINTKYLSQDGLIKYDILIKEYIKTFTNANTPKGVKILNSIEDAKALKIGESGVLTIINDDSTKSYIKYERDELGGLLKYPCEYES